MVPGLQHLEWPFFGPEHRALASRFRDWAAQAFAHDAHPRDARRSRCGVPLARRAVGAGGLDAATACARRTAARSTISMPARSAVLRESLAWWNGLADFAFAMQGLGSGALSIAGSPELKSRYLPRVARGEAIAAFALSEPAAGSDVAAMTCQARREGDAVRARRCQDVDLERRHRRFLLRVRAHEPRCRACRRLDRCGRHQRIRRGARRSGLVDRRAHRRDRAAPARHARLQGLPHPGATPDRRGGRRGSSIAMRTLDVFRASVAAAALGFGQRAFDEALAHAQARADVRQDGSRISS